MTPQVHLRQPPTLCPKDRTRVAPRVAGWVWGGGWWGWVGGFGVADGGGGCRVALVMGMHRSSLQHRPTNADR